MVCAALSISTALCQLGPARSEPLASRTAQEAPETLTFDELITLAATDPPPAALARKLEVLLTTPFISNRASARNIRRKAPTLDKTGPVFRVAEWNINRGENEDSVALALADAPGFLESAGRNPKLDRKQIEAIRGELNELQSADVVILDEVDRGVRRTKYHDVAKDLAEKLDMNYAYGVEFIELNRIYLGTKSMDAPDSARNEAGQTFGLDPKRYLGLEGSAILSRYPIRDARIIRLPEFYDWYHSEIREVSALERARRWSAQQLFAERIARQVRRGNRMALVVDLEVPQSPTGLITVVCPHLEDYVGPRGRREQMNNLLAQIRTEGNPLIVAGDLNTTGSSGRPVTVQRAIRRYLLNYKFWLRQVIFLIVPVPGLGYVFRGANYMKNLHDPTAFSIPILLPNPSRRFFRNVETFRFADGSRFDFRGRRELSFKRRGSTLSDTSGRDRKGFTPSFSFQRTFGGIVGRYKIDWFFIRHPAEPTEGTRRNGILSPQFGRTLSHMNTALGDRISDHCPITVTLPFSSER
jgi:endonuclease/exonuclease/phosphatase family metal-dependent hydrolase